jgi:hypothetical protein
LGGYCRPTLDRFGILYWRSASTAREYPCRRLVAIWCVAQFPADRATGVHRRQRNEGDSEVAEPIVPDEFVDHHTGRESLGRDAVLDQTLRSRRQDDCALTGPAAIVWAMAYDHRSIVIVSSGTARGLFWGEGSHRLSRRELAHPFQNCYLGIELAITALFLNIFPPPPFSQQCFYGTLRKIGAKACLI